MNKIILFFGLFAVIALLVSGCSEVRPLQESPRQKVSEEVVITYIDDDGVTHQISQSSDGTVCDLTAQCVDPSCDFTMRGCRGVNGACTGASCSCNYPTGSPGCSECIPTCVGKRTSPASAIQQN